MATGVERPGRSADSPTQLPKQGWWQSLKRTFKEMGNDHVALMAAGVAFYGLLAIFPGIAALVSIAGLVMDPATVEQQVESLSGILPSEAQGIIREQAVSVAQGAGGAVTFAAIGGILLSLYSAASGMKSLMEGMNIAYDETESRGFLKRNVVALGLTLAAIIGFILVIAIVLVIPIVLDFINLGSTVEWVITIAKWVLLAALAVFGLAVLYRFAPSRDDAKWQWLTPGALVATVLWIIGSIAFSIYVQNFASYNETYGSLGAAIILLMWLWLTTFIVLMGAEMNSELEHQTEKDTTTGPSRPMGQRGAVKADTRPGEAEPERL